MEKKQRDTSWNKSALWYDNLVESEGSYQVELILPNMVRLLGIKKGMTILDLACGQGLFSRVFGDLGAEVTGVDAASELIRIAKAKKGSPIDYHVSRADKIPFVKDASQDAVTIILALQNIENLAGVFKEVARVLKPQGRLLFVLNHPAFRIPKTSSWGWDDERRVQYRRVDQYLSESRQEIVMHPGEAKSEKTISFHRPLQIYIKALGKMGFAVTRLEEWNSHKKSEKGPRQTAEDKARKEIPLFLCIECIKIK